VAHAGIRCLNESSSWTPWQLMLKGFLKRALTDFSLLSCSLLWTFSVFFLFGVSCMAADKRPERRVVGGQCEYKAYPGTATILSVQKQEGPPRAGPSSTAVCEVKFSFTPDDEIEEDWVQVEGKEYLLLLADSRFPGPRFLEKYGIEPGKPFECDMKVIVRGTCTPVIFDFPTIDLSDYPKSE
jgi:hypothetical protein